MASRYPGVTSAGSRAAFPQDVRRAVRCNGDSLRNAVMTCGQRGWRGSFPPACSFFSCFFLHRSIEKNADFSQIFKGKSRFIK
jgi:hypothetical protein